MNVTNALLGRQSGLRSGHNLSAIDSAFRELTLSRQYHFTDVSDVGAPPLAMCLEGRMLCVANDSGDVALIDKDSMTGGHKWTAHHNAIFDIKWRTGFDNQLGTASGDKSINIWDINTAQSVYSYEYAHNGSIKSIDFKDQNVVASGARDGLIKIWDLRCGRGGSVIVIEKAHLSQLPSIKSSPKVKPQKTSPLNSVTCVVFNRLTDQLYSSGANDATVKIWDLRKCRKNRVNKTCPTPVRELYRTAKKGSPNHGFTCLTFSHDYNLFASCSDHNIYGYSGDQTLPAFTLLGAHINNFTRITTLNDYLIGGSVDGRSLIWSVGRQHSKASSPQRRWPIYWLPHSEEEVTAVVADRQWHSVYTCSDDQNINKWSLFDTKQDSQNVIKSHVFVPPVCEPETKEEKEKPIASTPSSSSGDRPLSSLTNWLATSGKQYLTPSYPKPKRMRLTQSTPNNRTSLAKENHSKSNSSKRKLFNTNRKISEYFTP